MEEPPPTPRAPPVDEIAPAVASSLEEILLEVGEAPLSSKGAGASLVSSLAHAVSGLFGGVIAAFEAVAAALLSLRRSSSGGAAAAPLHDV